MGTGGCESAAAADGFVSLNTNLVVALVASQRGGSTTRPFGLCARNPKGIVETGCFPASPLLFRRHCFSQRT